MFMASFFFSWNVLKLFHYARQIRVECKKCQAKGTCESDYNLYGVCKLVSCKFPYFKFSTLEKCLFYDL
jgi:hypothetical protein